MNKNLCTVDGCPNKGRYAKWCGHWADEEKQLKQDTKEYLRARKKFLKAHPNCSFEGCKKPATEVHHPKGRIGKLLTDPKNMKGFCKAHHAYTWKPTRISQKNMVTANQD